MWVVNRDQGTLMVFDADSGAALLPKPLGVGRGAHDVCISTISGKAYVTAETDNRVTAVDIDALLDAATEADIDALVTESIAVTPLP
ncbi:MAG TPA: hypothetical protein VF239_18475, partial [Vicinamibacterales bacterium]